MCRSHSFKSNGTTKQLKFKEGDNVKVVGVEPLKIFTVEACVQKGGRVYYEDSEQNRYEQDQLEKVLPIKKFYFYVNKLSGKIGSEMLDENGRTPNGTRRIYQDRLENWVKLEFSETELPFTFKESNLDDEDEDFENEEEDGN